MQWAVNLVCLYSKTLHQITLCRQHRLTRKISLMPPSSRSFTGKLISGWLPTFSKALGVEGEVSGKSLLLRPPTSSTACCASMQSTVLSCGKVLSRPKWAQLGESARKSWTGELVQWKRAGAHRSNSGFSPCRDAMFTAALAQKFGPGCFAKEADGATRLLSPADV